MLDLHALPDGITPIANDAFLAPKWALLPVTARDEAEGKISKNHAETSLLPSPDLVPVTGSITATLTKTTRVTPQEHWQDVRQFNFSTPKVEYGAGDILTIYPKNFPETVNEVLSVLGWDEDADRPMSFKRTEKHAEQETVTSMPISSLEEDSIVTPRQLLENHLDITAIPRRSFFASIAHFTTDETQKERLIDFTNPDLIDELYDYTTRPRRSIVEVLQEFNTLKIPIQWMASIFPVIRGRQFSIASGGDLKTESAEATNIELLVAIVSYRTVIRKIRQGLCTRYLSALPVDAKLNVTLSKAGMKVDMNKPALMIGPGTGVAPLRAMIYERSMAARLGATDASKQLLFFGCRNKSADFFYESEWEELSKTQPLEVFPAFSRDQVR